MTEKKLVIIGAGDFGRAIMYVAMEDISEYVSWRTVAFAADIEQGKTTHEGVEIVTFDKAAQITDDNTYFISGIGDPNARKKTVESLLEHIPNVKFATIIHRSVVIMPNCKIEAGVYIAPNVTIGTGSYIKSHAVINSNVSVGHDSNIGDFSIICPGCVLAGRTSIGEATLLGSGVVTYYNVQIGNRCAVSANTVVARNLKDRSKQIQKPDSVIFSSE